MSIRKRTHAWKLVQYRKQKRQAVPVVASGEPKELKAESPSNSFTDDESDRQIEFVFDELSVKVRFISQGLVTELKKVQS